MVDVIQSALAQVAPPSVRLPATPETGRDLGSLLTSANPLLQYLNPVGWLPGVPTQAYDPASTYDDATKEALRNLVVTAMDEGVTGVDPATGEQKGAFGISDIVPGSGIPSTYEMAAANEGWTGGALPTPYQTISDTIGSANVVPIRSPHADIYEIQDAYNFAPWGSATTGDAPTGQGTAAKIANLFGRTAATLGVDPLPVNTRVRTDTLEPPTPDFYFTGADVTRVGPGGNVTGTLEADRIEGFPDRLSISGNVRQTGDPFSPMNFADQVAEERYGVQRYGAGRDFINQQYAEEPDYNVQDQMAQWYERAFIDPDEYGWTRPTIEQRQEAIRGVQDAPKGFWGALQDRIANLIPGAEASVARDVEFEREQREPTWFPPTTSSGIGGMVEEPATSPFIGDAGFTPSLGGYTIGGPEVGDEEEEVSEERVKVIKKKPKEKRTSVEEQVVVASEVKKALDNASKGKKVKNELKAIVELAKVDPTIVARYTTPGSQALQDITAQVDSFSFMPTIQKKKKTVDPGAFEDRRGGRR